MKKTVFPLFIIMVGVLTFITMPKVFAAPPYLSTLNIPANSHVLGQYRWYDTKEFRIEISLDAYRDFTADREKLMWITLHYTPTTQVAGQMMNTNGLGTCNTAFMGTYKNGNYQYTFSTAYADNRQFCGLISNSVYMYQV